MRPELVAVTFANHGVFTRRDASRSGYSPSELRTLTRRGGPWVVLRRGVYAERALVDAADEAGRYLLRVRAATVTLRHHAVVSHTSALAALGLPLRPAWCEIVHVTRPGTGGSRGEHGVKHHPARLAAADVVEMHGLQVTSLARTAVDVGREHGFEDGLVACDASLRRGATRQQLHEVVGSMAYWPGVVPARAAVEAADSGAETVGESLARVLVLELGLGRPRTQVRISDGQRTAFVDLLLGRHIFEFDGRIKYVGRADGGVADVSPSQVLWEEKRREDWLRSQSFGVSRIVYADLFEPARTRARERLMREFLETRRRYPEDTDFSSAAQVLLGGRRTPA